MMFSISLSLSSYQGRQWWRRIITTREKNAIWRHHLCDVIIPMTSSSSRWRHHHHHPNDAIFVPTWRLKYTSPWEFFTEYNVRIFRTSTTVITIKRGCEKNLSVKNDSMMWIRKLIPESVKAATIQDGRFIAYSAAICIVRRKMAAIQKWPLYKMDGHTYNL